MGICHGAERPASRGWVIPPGQLGWRSCIPLRTGWPGPVWCGFLVAECEAVFPEQLARAGVISRKGASFLAQDIYQARRCFQFRLERPGACARVLAAQVRCCLHREFSLYRRGDLDLGLAQHLLRGQVTCLAEGGREQLPVLQVGSGWPGLVQVADLDARCGADEHLFGLGEGRDGSLPGPHRLERRSGLDLRADERHGVHLAGKPDGVLLGAFGAWVQRRDDAESGQARQRRAEDHAVAYPDFVADLVSVLFTGALGQVRIAARGQDRAEADAAPVGVMAQCGDQAADRFCGIQSGVMAGC